MVLTPEGYHSVEDTACREFMGNMVSIAVQARSENDPLLLTPEHPVLTKRGWIPASDLVESDYIAIARDSFLKAEDDTAPYKFDLAKVCDGLRHCRSEYCIWIHGSQNKSIPRYISLNKDFAHLFGLYLAEGSASKNGIVFSISQEEDDLTETLRRLVKSVWGLDIAVEDCSTSKKRWVRVYGDILKEFYRHYAGRGAHNKHIPFIDKLTAHTASKILRGMWEGDGSIESAGYEITTVSRQLAYDLTQLGDKLGMRFTVEYHIARNAYRVRISRPDAGQFASRLGHSRFRNEELSIDPERLEWSPIKALNTTPYSGMVCDIMLNDVHAFMTHHGIIHNSSSEASACKKPMLFPKNTSLVEIIGEEEERGYFIKSGGDLNAFTCLGAPDNNILRPTVDIYDMAAKLEHIYNNRKEALDKADRAYKEIWTWKQVGEAWKDIFREAEGITARLRSVEST